MAEEVVSKDQMNFTIDMLITMVVEELSEDLGKDTKDVLADFCVSKTGKALYDESTKLWTFIYCGYVQRGACCQIGQKEKDAFRPQTC